MRLRTGRLVREIFHARSVLLFATFLTLFLSASCGQNQTPAPGGYELELLPPERALPYLRVRLRDDAGLPVTDALVGVEGNMNHAGMVPVISKPVADTDILPSGSTDAGAADGIYHIPFEFTMLGDWIITVTAVVNVESGDRIARDFGVTVRADSISLNEP